MTVNLEDCIYIYIYVNTVNGTTARKVYNIKTNAQLNSSFYIIAVVFLRLSLFIVLGIAMPAGIAIPNDRPQHNNTTTLCRTTKEHTRA